MNWLWKIVWYIVDQSKYSCYMMIDYDYVWVVIKVINVSNNWDACVIMWVLIGII